MAALLLLERRRRCRRASRNRWPDRSGIEKRGSSRSL